jgi:hypothetical protein
MSQNHNDHCQSQSQSHVLLLVKSPPVPLLPSSSMSSISSLSLSTGSSSPLSCSSSLQHEDEHEHEIQGQKKMHPESDVDPHSDFIDKSQNETEPTNQEDCSINGIELQSQSQQSESSSQSQSQPHATFQLPQTQSSTLTSASSPSTLRPKKSLSLNRMVALTNLKRRLSLPSFAFLSKSSSSVSTKNSSTISSSPIQPPITINSNSSITIDRPVSELDTSKSVSFLSHDSDTFTPPQEFQTTRNGDAPPSRLKSSSSLASHLIGLKNRRSLDLKKIFRQQGKH